MLLVVLRLCVAGVKSGVIKNLSGKTQYDGAGNSCMVDALDKLSFRSRKFLTKTWPPIRRYS
jgi:hypothetical protein